MDEVTSGFEYIGRKINRKITVRQWLGMLNQMYKDIMDEYLMAESYEMEDNLNVI